MKKLKVLTVVGTRPEIIRLSEVIKRLDETTSIEHILVHTGQNYDYTLNEVFFEELRLRAPDYYLGVVGDNLGQTMGNVIAKRIIEGGYQILKVPIPCVVSLTPTGIPPRKPSLTGAIKARNAQITVFGIADIGLGTEKIGLSGSPTIVSNVVNIVSERAPITMSVGHNESALVDSLIANIKKGGNVLQKKEQRRNHHQRY